MQLKSNKIKCPAAQARETAAYQERMHNWLRAGELWSKAAELTADPIELNWCESRAKFCFNRATFN